jgi:hypothetical protein
VTEPRHTNFRTVVDFRKGANVVMTYSTPLTIPNVVLGQLFTFDHPTTARCLHGIVTKISHVVFLGREEPLTYIDVRVL